MTPSGAFSDDQVQWFRDHVGSTLWLGISAPLAKEVHGHRRWRILAVRRNARGRWAVSLTNHEHTAEVELSRIYHSFETEDDYRAAPIHRQWDRGLSDPPAVPGALPSWVR